MSYNQRLDMLLNLLKSNNNEDMHLNEPDYKTSLKINGTDDKTTDVALTTDNDFETLNNEEKINSNYLKKVVLKLREYVIKVMDGLMSIENKIQEMPNTNDDNDRKIKSKYKNKESLSKNNESAIEDDTGTTTIESESVELGLTTTERSDVKESSDELSDGNEKPIVTDAKKKTSCNDCEHCCEIYIPTTPATNKEKRRSFEKNVEKDNILNKNNEKWSAWSDWSGICIIGVSSFGYLSFYKPGNRTKLVAETRITQESKYPKSRQKLEKINGQSNKK